MKKEALTDAVKHPSHYTAHPSGIECHEITGLLGGNLSNVVKYVWRYDQKGKPVEDLKKALQYLEFEKKDFEGLGAEAIDKRTRVGIVKIDKVVKFEKNIFKRRIFERVANFLVMNTTSSMGQTEAIITNKIKELESENN
jgi:hypothetical protein